MTAPVIPLAINGRFLTQPVTGVQRVARELTREIDRLVASGEAQFDVSLICPRNAALDDLKLSAIKVERVAGGDGYFWEQTSLAWAARGKTLLCLGNTAPIASLMGRKPVAVVVHDLSHRSIPSAYQRSYRAAMAVISPLVLKRARPLITVSEAEKRNLSALAPAEAAARMIVAQNGGWRQDGAEADAQAPRRAEPFVLYVGALSKRKNFGGVIQTAIRLAREDGIATVIAGSKGAVHSREAIDIPPDLSHFISFTGQADDAQLADLYATAECLLFPSFYEASPLPPLEAMHFDCPVVVSDIPALRERCGEAAEYCDPSSVDSMVEAVRRVKRSTERRRELIEKGRAQSRRFSWRRQAETVLAAIRAAHEKTAPAAEADAGASA